MWQPIETAPKDGTLILILDTDGNPHLAEWGEDYEDRTRFSWVTNEESSHGGEICYGEDAHEWRPYAVYWMPLPDPPSD